MIFLEQRYSKACYVSYPSIAKWCISSEKGGREPSQVVRDKAQLGTVYLSPFSELSWEIFWGTIFKRLLRKLKLKCFRWIWWFFFPPFLGVPLSELLVYRSLVFETHQRQTWNLSMWFSLRANYHCTWSLQSETTVRYEERPFSHVAFIQGSRNSAVYTKSVSMPKCPKVTGEFATRYYPWDKFIWSSFLFFTI